MANYILRKVDDQLWARVRARAQSSRWPLRALILRLLEDYADGRLEPSGAPPPLPDRQTDDN